MSLIEDLKLALTGDAKAISKIVKEVEDNKLSPEEIKHIQQLATGNVLKANSHVFYLAGLTYHQQKNYAKAIVLFEQAIVTGHANAMNYRGSMYYEGQGGPVDYAKAIILFDKAIELGNANAMFYRASMHDKGQGGPIDYSKAIPLYNKAIKLGNASAMNNRADMHCKGQGGPIDYAKAIALFDKAIELDNANAMNNRALMHCEGKGGPVNSAKAIALFEKAIELGNTQAMSNRAYMYSEGTGGPVNYAKAIALLNQAIALGNRGAMLDRAFMHDNGLGREAVDYDAAAYLYRKAYLLDQNDEIGQEAITDLRSLASKTPRTKYQWTMVTGASEITKLVKQDPQTFLRCLVADDLLSNTEKYPYLEQVLKQYPRIKTKITDQISIALLEEYAKTQASADNDAQVSSLISIDVSIWQYLVTYLSRADKASLRLVCQFFFRNVLSSPLLWEQWVDVDQLVEFQQKGKRFGWGMRPIYGAFFSPYTSFPKSLQPPLVTALDLSQSDAFFKASSNDLLIFFAKLPKQLKYLKLQWAGNITQPVTDFLVQNYPGLRIYLAVIPTIKVLESMLQQLPQTAQIINLTSQILDGYYLVVRNIFEYKEKLCAAVIASARYLTLGTLKEAWPDEYVTKTKMTFDSFKKEYDLTSRIATLVVSMLSNQQVDEGAKMQDNLDYEYTTDGVSLQ